ncbi:leiomodin-1 [Hoplias malabaricus]|uniref:leiomodin-1 n=1 Tax=Hoplias malabaricus TaxID=27720 RepID=UPI0034625BD5
MSRRKVRGLTRTGRQVSEDPDLDNLLSNLSPEEMEELQKEVSTVPDPDPSEIIIVDQTDLKQGTAKRKESSLSSRDDETTARLQRNLSTEGEHRRESRKQEYLRKMGLSQEKNDPRTDTRDRGLQRQTSVSTPSVPCMQEKKRDSMTTRPSEESQYIRAGQFRREEQSTNKTEVKEIEMNNDCKLKERRDTKEGSSKTKELISKLQERKEDTKEKDRREESRKKESVDGKMKNLISKLQEKEDRKEQERREEVRKREESKKKGIFGKLEEKQNQVAESKSNERRKGEKGEKEKINKQPEFVKSSENDKESAEKDVRKDTEITNKEKEKERKGKELLNAYEELKTSSVDKEKKEAKRQNEVPEPTEEAGNCVAETNVKMKSKEEEDDEESASMFAEDLEKVRRNDPGMSEINVNNSEVIKVKTLIQFAEALKNNTQIKTFALANCRADDHVAFAIAETLRNNKSITSINLDSNLLTSKGIMALIQALQHNSTLTELRFHNQRHICGGKTEMEMTKILKENTTLLKLGYHFELAGPRMTMTNILSRNMDRQRQKRLQEQKQAQAQGNRDKKDSLEVPKPGFSKSSPRSSPKPSPTPSPVPSPKLTPRKGIVGSVPPPPPPGCLPPPPPPPPNLDGDFLKNSLTPVSKRKLEDKSRGRGSSLNSRDQLLASIRDANKKQLKKVALPKLLQ